ncbi:uncharacterized protein F4812DRAFT_184716 [Daldinia caldariorum]|uniref:uncharacterized protein n=1 Tax=Daldinia caldariorum TaxID=326644 RepID=UPI002007D7C1|nr:uncharacterized protein F4812DRAFT_184716 [Daldinia caldariorum]KAI1471586.1 hypothetical protein F4812DRAFT_184716 [Daldinia caldariorum]
MCVSLFSFSLSSRRQYMRFPVIHLILSNTMPVAAPVTMQLFFFFFFSFLFVFVSVLCICSVFYFLSKNESTCFTHCRSSVAQKMDR